MKKRSVRGRSRRRSPGARTTKKPAPARKSVPEILGSDELRKGIIPGTRSLCRTVRLTLGWTQAEMAGHLGVSRKAVESYEQRWRKTPLNVERLALLFLGCLRAMAGGKRRIRCWELRGCADETRRRCPTWKMRRGDICWLLAGTYCDGRKMRSWKEKWDRCKRCEVLRVHFADVRPALTRKATAPKM